MNPDAPYAATAAMVPPETAERLWHDYSALAGSYGHKAQQALARQREYLRLAAGYRAQIPPARLAQLEAERLLRAAAP